MNASRSGRAARRKSLRRSARPSILRHVAFAMSLYPVWTDVDAIYQVLKQAGEIRGNSTNSPSTPPTAEHPPSGAAPSSARASSHPCSSSTSGKSTTAEFPPDLGTAARRNSPPTPPKTNFLSPSLVRQWRSSLARRIFVKIKRESNPSSSNFVVESLNFLS